VDGGQKEKKEKKEEEGGTSTTVNVGQKVKGKRRHSLDQ
jgi:hypothetical protein